MSSELVQFRTIDSTMTLEVLRSGGSAWTCPVFSEFSMEDSKQLKGFPTRMLVWYACDCAERQFSPTRDRLEQEWIMTDTARRWVAGLTEAEACEFDLDETIQTTIASWCAAQAVNHETREYASSAARCVLHVLPPEDVKRELGWQRVRLSVLASLSPEIWDDTVPIQAAHEMAEDEQRPWSETFLELVGVPREAWNAIAPPD